MIWSIIPWIDIRKNVGTPSNWRHKNTKENNGLEALHCRGVLLKSEISMLSKSKNINWKERNAREACVLVHPLLRRDVGKLLHSAHNKGAGEYKVEGRYCYLERRPRALSAVLQFFSSLFFLLLGCCWGISASASPCLSLPERNAAVVLRQGFYTTGFRLSSETFLCYLKVGFTTME